MSDSRAHEHLLVVDGLGVTFGRHCEVTAVRDVSLHVDAGECLALVGESGSGKSVTARAVTGLNPDGATTQASTLTLDGTDLLGLGATAWRHIRGGRIGTVPQDALSSLDPLRTVGAEITEALRNHCGLDRDECDAEVVRLLTEVGMPDPDLHRTRYPHQLSGGQCQRALIACAIAADPPLLVADEPTTALDVAVQARILDLLGERLARGTALLLITHDLAVAARLADRVAVMRHGAIVEEGPATRVLTEPTNPYTRRLLESVPSARPVRHPASVPAGRDDGATAPPVIDVRDVRRTYQLPGGRSLTAVDGVSLSVHAGESLGVLGESGSGKSTLADLVVGLSRPDEGSILLDGQPWSEVPAARRRHLRRRVQLVHQNPLAAFDPRYTVDRVVGEALGAPGRLPAGVRERVAALLTDVGLDPALARRRPHELSGGQRQRVALARALAPQPRLLVCDEPVSALDVSVQAQILDLFAEVRERLGVALLFISHDVDVVAASCDRVVVMRAGQVVESGDVDVVLSDPTHPYTRDLLEAVPRLPVPIGAATTAEPISTS